MTLSKKDLIILAGGTLEWAAQNDCVKDGETEYAHFTVDKWRTRFGHSGVTFGRVKREMVELGISIALQPSHGHYISDLVTDMTSTIEIDLKNILTRLETVSAIVDSAQKSKHSVEIMERLRQVVDQLDLQLNDNGKLTFQSQVSLLIEKSV